ncbi:MAG: hypothetical protein EAZ89_13200 [Bacteroidetes bacterium]|nr:MAG: hypothetical protein EAZ89_13200 [Bacteroidota bacterium]
MYNNKQIYMRTYSWAIALLLAAGITLLSACNDLFNIDPTAWTHYYNETQCADPWQRGATDSLTFAAITAYLDSNDIAVIQIGVENDSTGAQVCQACNCTSGNVFKVIVSDADGVKLMNLGEGWYE